MDGKTHSAKAKRGSKYRRKKSPPRNRLEPLGGMKNKVPAVGISKNGIQTFREERSEISVACDTNSVRSRGRLAKGDLAFKDLSLGVKKVKDINQQLVDSGISRQLVDLTGITSGYLLHLKNETWNTFWVSLDPNINMLSLSVDRFNFDGVGLRQYVLCSKCRVQLPGKIFISELFQNFYVIKLTIPGQRLLLAASTPDMAETWAKAFRYSFPRKRRCTGEKCMDHCQDSLFTREKRQGQLVQRESEWKPKSFDVREMKLGNLGQFYFYDYFKGSDMAKVSREQSQSLVTRGVLKQFDLAIRTTYSLSDQQFEYQVVSIRDSTYCATKLQAFARANYARKLVKFMRQRRKAKRAQNAAARERFKSCSVEELSTSVRKAVVLAPKIAAHNSTIIQKYIRRFLAQCKVVRYHESVTRIANFWRAWLYRIDRAILRIQSVWRMVQAYRERTRLRCIVRYVSARYVLRYLIPEEFKRIRAATLLQAMWRSYLVRVNINIARKGFTVIQALQRKRLAKMSIFLMHWSALLIQKRWRGFLYRRDYLQARSAFLLIQKRIRGKRIQREYQRQRKAMVLIATRIRGRMARKAFALKRQSAVKIESVFRMCLVRMRCNLMREKGLAITSFARMVAPRKYFWAVAKSVLLIQAFTRKTITLVWYTHIRKNIIRIQAFLRMFLGKCLIYNIRKTIYIQKYVRRFLAKASYEKIRALCRIGFTNMQRYIRGAMCRRMRFVQLRHTQEGFYRVLYGDTNVIWRKVTRCCGNINFYIIRCVPCDTLNEFCWEIERRTYPSLDCVYCKVSVPYYALMEVLMHARPRIYSAEALVNRILEMVQCSCQKSSAVQSIVDNACSQRARAMATQHLATQIMSRIIAVASESVADRLVHSEFCLRPEIMNARMPLLPVHADQIHKLLSAASENIDSSNLVSNALYGRIHKVAWLSDIVTHATHGYTFSARIGMFLAVVSKIGAWSNHRDGYCAKLHAKLVSMAMNMLLLKYGSPNIYPEIELFRSESRMATLTRRKVANRPVGEQLKQNLSLWETHSGLITTSSHRVARTLANRLSRLSEIMSDIEQHGLSTVPAIDKAMEVCEYLGERIDQALDLLDDQEERLERMGETRDRICLGEWTRVEDLEMRHAEFVESLRKQEYESAEAHLEAAEDILAANRLTKMRLEFVFEQGKALIMDTNARQEWMWQYFELLTNECGAAGNSSFEASEKLAYYRNLVARHQTEIMGMRAGKHAGFDHNIQLKDFQGYISQRILLGKVHDEEKAYISDYASLIGRQTEKKFEELQGALSDAICNHDKFLSQVDMFVEDVISCWDNVTDVKFRAAQTRDQVDKRIAEEKQETEQLLSENLELLVGARASANNYWWSRCIGVYAPSHLLREERQAVDKRIKEAIEKRRLEKLLEEANSDEDEVDEDDTGDSSSEDSVRDEGRNGTEEDPHAPPVPKNEFDDGGLFALAVQKKAKKQTVRRRGAVVPVKRKLETRTWKEELTLKFKSLREDKKKKLEEARERAALSIQTVVRWDLACRRFQEQRLYKKEIARVYNAASRIQALCRVKYVVPDVLRATLIEVYHLVFHFELGLSFYYNTRTGTSSWDKPLLLEEMGIELEISELPRYGDEELLENLRPSLELI